jgi:hypothetical protein
MGLVYLAAFWSLGVQVEGLAGRDGILPAASYLEAARSQIGVEAYWRLPTICWFVGAGDPSLKALCATGAALGILLITGLAPLPSAVGAWVLYLSLASVCRTFLNFQWDALLLEAGFLAIFMAPPRLRCRLPCLSGPPRLALWLVWWLLFRLMFSSGVVKLLSGDATWWQLRALDVHYETQPIPTWSAWYAHQMPGWFQSCSVAIMFFIELVVPWFIAGPRLARRAACAILAGLQLVIAATGNYAFFNLLTLALCLPLLDDAVWPRRWRPLRGIPDPSAPSPLDEPNPPVAPSPPDSPPLRRGARWPVWVAAPFAAILVVLSLLDMTARFRLPIPWPGAVLRLSDAIGPYRIVNAYGLFAAMTTERPEIVVEGSDDGQTWLPYEFHWKPGEVTRRPVFVAPHQPRLDWQMWFAALGSYRNQPWFQAFLARLLQGSPPVLALLERNPFPDAPPRYIRSVVYDYRFTDWAARRATGAWWRREMKGLYSPPQSLRR